MKHGLGAAHRAREELAALEALVPRDAVAGTRDAAAQMAHLDRER